jgi:hypothetical protein
MAAPAATKVETLLFSRDSAAFASHRLNIARIAALFARVV